MSRKKEKKVKTNRIFIKIIVIAIFLIAIIAILQIAPNYVRDKETGKINILINNNNVTNSMKYDIFLQNGIIYMSTKDIANFLDENIYYDNNYNQILTGSDTKMASMPINKNEMYINSVKQEIKGKAIQKDETFYLPVSEMNNIYNIEIEYIEDTNRVIIDSISREKKMANSAGNYDVKSLPTSFSKTVAKIKKGENVTIVKDEENETDWIKIRTKDGIIGYVKKVANTYSVRENMEKQKQIDGTISMFWDYYSEYADAPERTEKISGVNVVSPAFVHLSDEEEGDIDLNIG